MDITNAPNVGKKRNRKKGSRKAGRNKVKCARYRLEERREKNKARRIAKDLKRKKV